VRGVRIKETGNSGAEKIFNLIRKMDRGDGRQAVEQAVRLISQKSNYIRAMNFIIAKNDKIYLNSIFNENQSYFMMHKKNGDSLIISSVPYPSTNYNDWSPIYNSYCGEI
jgi:23S rRNA C2498 (ribose-2'-O)-methylase RlmM